MHIRSAHRKRRMPGVLVTTNACPWCMTTLPCRRNAQRHVRATPVNGVPEKSFAMGMGAPHARQHAVPDLRCFGRGHRALVGLRAQSPSQPWSFALRMMLAWLSSQAQASGTRATAGPTPRPPRAPAGARARAARRRRPAKRLKTRTCCSRSAAFGMPNRLGLWPEPR